MIRKWLTTVLLCWTVSAFVLAADRFTLVIDAGHGGHDAGALGAKSKEKNINLKVALAFGNYVERNCSDVKVIYTRKTDVFIPLNERANIANRNKADLFISIHTNALPKGKIARGFEVYTLGMHAAAENLAVAKRENSVILVEKDYKQHYEGFDPNSSESYIIFEFMQDKNMAKSVELAQMIQKEACATSGRANKGVHQAGFLVLRATSMPSCLVELGFITTPDEENYLNTNAGVDALAKGIYQAFKRYKKKHYGSSVPFEEEADQSSSPTIAPPVKTQAELAKQEQKREVLQQKPAESEAAENQSEPLPSGMTSVASSNSRNVPPVGSNATDAIHQNGQPNGNNTANATEPVQSAPLQETPTLVADNDDSAPVFKVQIMASDSPLREGHTQFKGEKNVEFYEEGGWVKYTIGASTDYSAISQLRKTLAAKFPKAFIVAFKNGEKMNVQQAIKEYRLNRKQ